MDFPLLWRQPVFLTGELLWPWLFFNWVKSLFPLEEEDLQRILVEKIKWSLTERSSLEKHDIFKRPSRALLALKNEKRVVLLKKTPAWILCGENN